MNRTINTPEGRYYLIYHRPQAEPRAVQVEGYFYPVDSDSEIEISEHTYYAEDSISEALKQYLRKAQQEVKGMSL